MLSRFSLPAVVAFALCASALPARADEGVATLAQIKLTGSLDETPVGNDPLFGTSAENFKSKLDRIKKAKEDPSIQALLLQIEDLGTGWGKIDELRRAIADFRKSGKKTYAYLEAGAGKDYLLAAACDEIFVPESGWLMLTGLRAEVSFYKDTLDLIGVKADMMQMGEFKGAAEPMTRNSMSPQLRQELTNVLDDYYENSLVKVIADSRPRKWTADQVKKLIDGGPYTARAAAAAGLVDRVAYPEQIKDFAKKALKVERVKISQNYAQAKADDVDLSNPFALLKLFSPAKPALSFKPKIAVLYATGVIASGNKDAEGFLGGHSIHASTMIEAIRQAEEDKTVKAIVLRVDSPGGSALASDLIWNELNHCKKPVVASMSDTAASGGYYISMAARKIYAEPGTLTGSIGVVGGKLVLGQLYDKIGLKTEIIARGANANILSTTTPFTESEHKAMNDLMKDVYDQFLDKALAGRKKAGREMTRPELEKLAAGRIWTGRQAQANGLVDALGTLEDAIAEAKVMGGMDKDAKPDLLILPKPKSFLEELMDLKADTRAPAAGMALQSLLREFPEAAGKLRAGAGLLRLRGEPVWVLLPCHIEVR